MRVVLSSRGGHRGERRRVIEGPEAPQDGRGVGGLLQRVQRQGAGAVIRSLRVDQGGAHVRVAPSAAVGQHGVWLQSSEQEQQRAGHRL